MLDRSESVFGNVQSQSTVKKAAKSKAKYIKKFGDDSSADYSAVVKPNEYIGELLGVKNIIVGEDTPGVSEGFDEDKGIIVGNIRMGFGHYRISMAIASAAKSLGFTPYWMDLNSYKNTTCTKVISAQNDLYSLGSRISQKSRLFNKFVWEPMNYEGFKKLSYNAPDQKNAELMAPVYKNVPKTIPVVATHVWPAQAALHAGMQNVVNAVPDNWPMALHYAEGSVHTIQTHYAYEGYRTLNGMRGKEVLKPMPNKDLKYVGHYIDHEIVSNIESDCSRRITRKKNGQSMRFLLTIGGAGAQKEIFASIVKDLLPEIKNNRVVLYINIGDYINVWDDLKKLAPGMEEVTKTHFNDWDDTIKFAQEALNNSVTGDINSGIHLFCHENIFQAVYATNLLMRACDVLVTKPSELAFYPVPKLFIKRIGGHEQWGAIHSAEIGDGTTECRDIPHVLQMMRMFIDDDTYLIDMCNNITNNKKAGIYNGAYETVKIAMGLKNNR